jgi:cytochrome c oxidase subunit 2
MAINRYEKYWLTAVGIMLGAFVAALAAGLFVFGVKLPTTEAIVNPSNLAATRFAKPGVIKTGDGKVDVVMVAKMWYYDVGTDGGTVGAPPKIKIAKGTEATFYVTSSDVTHGFQIEDHNANVEVVPGEVARLTVKFNRPGQYHMICNQYCGAAHQGMYGTIIVE